ncbi:MAG: type II toxin-antitoxin system death-on-curing family toxin [Planctomycetota bacterium]
MKWLTVSELLGMHARVVEATGGALGVMNPGGLESALARPFTTVGGVDAFPELFDKVAALIHALIAFHPFVDGNKRIGLVAGDMCLRLNRWRVPWSADVEPFFWSIARGEQSVETISAWLRARCERYTPP